MKAKQQSKIKKDWKTLKGKSITFRDKDGKLRRGAVRLKEVRCGKEGCTKCPHKRYAYAQYRVGKKVTEKYLGIAKG